MAGSVVWSKVPDDERDDDERRESGEIDESFAARRLRRWIAGMFGGKPKRAEEPSKDEPTEEPS